MDELQWWQYAFFIGLGPSLSVLASELSFFKGIFVWLFNSHLIYARGCLWSYTVVLSHESFCYALLWHYWWNITQRKIFPVGSFCIFSLLMFLSAVDDMVTIENVYPEISDSGKSSIFGDCRTGTLYFIGNLVWEIGARQCYSTSNISFL